MLISKKICDELDDLQIIRKALAETDYFSCLYERYEAQLLRYVQRVAALSEEEAQDVLQEAFIKIWRHLNAFDPQLRLSSWMYRIVHNEAVSALRKKTSFGKDQQLVIDESLQSRLAAEWPDLGYNDEIEDREHAIRTALSELALPHREVLVLRFMEDMSYEEISDVLKIPEGTVATRLNRAKKALAAAFASYSSNTKRP
ncbi:MAG: RNA polymerase sigma factor [Saprospiraceae bacterium]|nr:RNA polymerase sigma factor [Saprospiraceae bacterium]HRF37372.1 RNA polymerase sigma factor [Saprospiraceae bacterium]HRJ15671.1 RNA polymerase sigma factor [Saprospiraceae bacterium]HRK80322.1 RNA polymerase sigma factor [Saprospiraceae bacterium]